MPSFKDLVADNVYRAAYYIAVAFFKLSKLPVAGKPFEALCSDGRLRVVTVPVDAKIVSTSAIMPFDIVRRLVEASSYVAIRDTCMCRQALGCKEYPISPGCVYLGEGARSIKHRMKQSTRQEALEWLEKARSLGLVTNVIWSSVEFKALGADAARTIEICSCCPCCCLMFKTRDASKAYLDNFLGFGTCKVADIAVCSRCTRCEQACPFRAITVDLRDGPSIDVARCKGCGRCEAVCPAKVMKVFPNGHPEGLEDTYERSTANADEMLERFLAMVR